MKGPFLRERDIEYPQLFTAMNDHLVRTLVSTGLAALGWTTPWGHRVTTTGSTTFTTTMWVIHRVHGSATNAWTDTGPARGACLAQRAQKVLVIGYFAKSCTAFGQHLAHLAGAQSQRGIGAFTRYQLY